MTSQKKFSPIARQCFILFVCLFARVPLLSAQSVIISHPQSQEICKGATARLQIEVQGQHIFKWQRKENSVWIDIPAWIYPVCNAETAGEYRCVVNPTTAAEEYSNIATVTVNDKPALRSITEVSGITATTPCDGGSVTAKVEEILTNGSDLVSYEWFFNNVSHGGVVENVTNNTVSDMIIPSAAYATMSGKLIKIKLTNSCGTTSGEKPITVRPIPSVPTPVVYGERNTNHYCLNEDPIPLKTQQDNTSTSEITVTAVWYDNESGGPEIQTPVPDTSIPGQRTWWVSEKVVWRNGPTCESSRVAATVDVLPYSDSPNFQNNYDLCLNDPDIILNDAQEQGTDIKWYDRNLQSMVTPIRVITSRSGTQTFYITQREAGKCESLKEDGKVTILIRERANIEAVSLLYGSESCPNRTVSIEATSQVAYSTIRWYLKSDRSGGAFHIGTSFTTPALMRDTSYYVSVQYGDMCESSTVKDATIFVRDATLPRIVAPSNITVNTDDGECFASVQPERPTVSDNCTYEDNLILSIDSEVVSFPLAPITYPLGPTTIMWEVTDEAGLFNYALQNITVVDREKPKGTNPGEIIWEINEEETSAIVGYELIYTDNCGKDNLNYTLSRGFASGSEFPLGETPVRYYISDAYGNTDTCEFKVIVRHPYRPMVVALNVSNYNICRGEEVVITPVINGGSGRCSYSWTTPRQWTEAVMKDYPSVNTTYELTVSDGITTEKKTVNITVRQKQDVKLVLEGRPAEEIFEGDEVLVTATSGFTSYQMLLNGQLAGLRNSVDFQAELGLYQVQVFATDVNGCIAQDLLTIEVESKKLPNVFTPNLDSKNDIFLKGFLKETDLLEVFNRAGVRLYSGYVGWDGYYKGRLMPQGTYLYVVRRKMNNGEQRIYKGTVTIKL